MWFTLLVKHHWASLLQCNKLISKGTHLSFLLSLHRKDLRSWLSIEIYKNKLLLLCKVTFIHSLPENYSVGITKTQGSVKLCCFLFVCLFHGMSYVYSENRKLTACNLFNFPQIKKTYCFALLHSPATRDIFQRKRANQEIYSWKPIYISIRIV